MWTGKRLPTGNPPELTAHCGWIQEKKQVLLPFGLFYHAAPCWQDTSSPPVALHPLVGFV